MKRGFQQIFLNLYRIFISFQILGKNLMKGQKVKVIAFTWPYWHLKVHFGKNMDSWRYCQAVGFGFVSLNDLVLDIIFESLCTGREYVE